MRGCITVCLLLIALHSQAQKRSEVVTDSAVLSFMQWRLSTLHIELGGGKTRLNLFVCTLPWQSMPWMSEGKSPVAGVDTLIQQNLGLTHGTDSAAYTKAISKCRPPQEQRIIRPKTFFTLQDLVATARSFDKQPELMWPAAFPKFRRKDKPLPACCAFTQPIFCANGQIALLWEYVFGQEGLAIYQRISVHEWCLIGQPDRIMD